MSIEGTQELHPSEIDHETEPRSHGNPWVRVIIYLVIVGAGSYLGWRIYQNHQAAVAASTQQAKALLSRPTPVQVTAVAEPYADLSDGTGHRDALHERDGEGAGERRTAAGKVYRRPGSEAGRKRSW